MARVLERGVVAFLYRPRVETFAARSLDDVQGFFVVLAPERGQRARRVRVGRKRLPDTGRHERFWAYVERVGTSASEVIADVGPALYWTKTRGLRHQPGPRLAGHGVYAIARHADHVHLAYALAQPGRRGEVQEELRIAPQASYVVAVFARSTSAAHAPEARRFVALDPAHLDEPGTEMVLIGSGEAVEDEVGAALDAQSEEAQGAELLDDLRRALEHAPPAPLLQGVWR